MGTRGVPSASQSMAAGYDSEIEEVDVPYRVTMIGPADVAGAADGDLELQCRRDLLELREKMAQESEAMREYLNEEAIDMLSVMLPNDIETLRRVLDEVGITPDQLKPHTSSILSICTKYHMMRR
ncbi:hypothetical protein OH77DRAFT_1467857 [Trametes cingulata]|nr:hypothetical protein OH77DRAFT_1467857 [Trametes cingulata]